MSGMNDDRQRRQILKILMSLGVSGPLALDLAAQAGAKIPVDTLRNAAEIRGETFSGRRLQAIEPALQRNLDEFQIVRDFELDDLTEPAPVFLSTHHAAPAITPVRSHEVKEDNEAR